MSISRVPSGGEDVDEDGARNMSRTMLQRLCREQGLYSTPACNASLFLQGMRFKSLSGLGAKHVVQARQDRSCDRSTAARRNCKTLHSALWLEIIELGIDARPDAAL